jgi:hypothetical protein
LKIITQKIRARIDMWHYIKVKGSFTPEETITRMMIKLTKWEKIFASSSSGKGKIPEYMSKNSNTNEQIMQLINKHIN